MQTLKNRRAKAASPLHVFVQKLQHVETLNICVLTSIGGLAAQADPARWYALVVDAFDAAREAQDVELANLLAQIIDHAEKTSR